MFLLNDDFAISLDCTTFTGGQLVVLRLENIMKDTKIVLAIKTGVNFFKFN